MSASNSKSGNSFADIFSNVRENYQQSGIDQCSNDSAADQVANSYGRNIGIEGGSCRKSCVNMVPSTYPKSREFLRSNY